LTKELIIGMKKKEEERGRQGEGVISKLSVHSYPTLTCAKRKTVRQLVDKTAHRELRQSEAQDNFAPTIIGQ
jgi:hypothetical protein